MSFDYTKTPKTDEIETFSEYLLLMLKNMSPWAWAAISLCAFGAARSLMN